MHGPGDEVVPLSLSFAKEKLGRSQRVLVYDWLARQVKPVAGPFSSHPANWRPGKEAIDDVRRYGPWAAFTLLMLLLCLGWFLLPLSGMMVAGASHSAARRRYGETIRVVGRWKHVSAGRPT
jgi:hypothetical protein